jgi:hypothetical protein
MNSVENALNAVKTWDLILFSLQKKLKLDTKRVALVSTYIFRCIYVILFSWNK